MVDEVKKILVETGVYYVRGLVRYSSNLDQDGRLVRLSMLIAQKLEQITFLVESFKRIQEILWELRSSSFTA
ncbi:hypothetical protein M5K25_016135 [Dendrobium thyrsiflorum]|uniref:Uncharacterized protein n=1 Tax=Dendrobium thyrsiflorum TaxID=117978 RepID=A0ABD0UZD6_DENTH